MTFVLMLFTMLAAGPAQSGTAATAEQEVRDLEQKYNAAYAANDLSTYLSSLAPDFMQWLPSGRTDKPSYEQSWTRFITGAGKATSVDLSEMQIKVGPSGDSDDTYQETDVLFRRAGAWKVVYLHYSPAPKKKTP